jgi:hypothetical protein
LFVANAAKGKRTDLVFVKVRERRIKKRKKE